MSSPSKTVFKVSQVLNAALSASVIICLAQGLPGVVSSENFPGNIPSSVFFAGTIVAYNLKQYVDEYRTFEYAENEEFSMSRTIFFSTVAYLFLASAGYSLSQPKVAAGFVIAYFVTLVIWSAFSAVARFSYSESEQNIDKLRRRLLWVVLYLIGAAIVSVLVINEKLGETLWLLAAALLLAVLYIYDLRDSNTFDSKHTKGV